MKTFYSCINTLTCVPILFLLFNCTNNNDVILPNLIEKPTEFIKTFGGSLNESAQSIINTSDGGYAVLGYTQSMDGNVENKQDTSFNYWLLKFNTDDELQWQKNYGGSDDDKGKSIIQTIDDGYAVLGYSKSNDGNITENFGADDFWVLKLDTNGSIKWETSLGFSGADKGYNIIQTLDQGFLVTGVLDVTASNGLGNTKNSVIKRHAGGDYWAVKLNANGKIEWSKFFGGTFTDTPSSVIATHDNAFIIVGGSDSDDIDITDNKGTYDFWVIKISSIGDLLWEKSFGGSQIDEAWDIVMANDGNFVIVGDTRSNDISTINNNGGADILIIKISTEGNILWQNTIGGTSFDASRAIHKTVDGGYLIAGNSRSSNLDITKNNGQNDALLLKISSQGILEWQKTIGGSNVDLAFDVIQKHDNSIIVVGESNSSDIDIINNKGFTDLLIFKIN